MTLRSVKTKGPAGPPSPEALKRITARVQRAKDEEVVEEEEEGQIQAIYDKLGLDASKRRSMAATQEDLSGGAGSWYCRGIWRLNEAAASAGDWVVQKTGVSSVALSLTAAVLFGATAVSIYAGHLLIGSGFLLVSGAAEAIDAVAAMNSPVARRDVYIDYMVDRLTDIFLFGAIAAAYAETVPLIMWLSAGTLVCSLLSSYGRAQAEALRFSARSRFNRLERLICVFVGLIGTAGLHLIGYRTNTVLIVSLFFSLGFTIFTLAERVFSTIRTVPYTEVIVETWDDDSLLPRLMDVLGSKEGFTIIESAGKGRFPARGGEVVHIDRYKDRTRVRIYKNAM